MYKCLNNNIYPLLKDKISFNFSTHDHAIRFGNKLKPIRERLELCRNSYLSQSISMWNDLSEHIKELKPLHTFKKKVKQLFIDALK